MRRQNAPTSTAGGCRFGARATAGSVLGAIVLYLVGRVTNAERLERIFDGKLGNIFTK
jgi:membrane protein DedA with SNARE-associated domain